MSNSARKTRSLAGIAAAVLVTLLGGCGGDSGQEFRPETLDPGPIHVHGLGIDPADGALFIATHTGLFRVEEGETKATRIAGRYQDTMGFTIVAADRFLGSGHPDLQEAREKDWPPLLGLIESRDHGQTWTPISLLGEADFHVLRSYRDRVYGFDATNNRLLVSHDAGKTWTKRSLPAFPPAPLIDLAVSPANAEHFIATSEGGLYESADEGRSWQQLGNPAGLLAWPVLEQLYLVAPGGLVLVSSDGGREWQNVGQVGGEPAALLATSADKLYVALHDGTIKHSSDGGVSWKIRSTP
jgi:hypothetical protein